MSGGLEMAREVAAKQIHTKNRFIERESCGEYL
jgi:hypothetical protein